MEIMARSMLFNIEPIGIGTPLVESLTSYITRLSEAHCVLTGSLISKVYAPLLNKEYLSQISVRGGNGFFDSAIGINGFGKLAGEFIELTESFTGRTDLIHTTLSKLSGIVPDRGLLKKTKSWCPLCYEDARVKDQAIYDPLIWNLQLVNTCLKHKTPLENVCNSCEKFIPVINRRSTPGTCSRCGHWLGANHSNIAPVSDEDELLLDVSLIGELLAEEEFNFQEVYVKESVNFYVSSLFDETPTKAARFFSIPRSTFILWMSGQSKPSIKYLLKISRMLGISVIEFLEKKINVKCKNSKAVVSKLRERYDHNEIQSMLSKVITEKQPVSISELSRRIGCDRKLLSTMYKDECEQIKANYSYHIQEKRKQNEQLKLVNLEEVVRSLVSQGVYPSRRQVEKVLGTGFLKESAVQKQWSYLKKEWSV